MDAKYLHNNGELLLTNEEPIKVVFTNAPPYEGDLEGLGDHVRKYNARFAKGSKHGDKNASFLPRFVPTSDKHRAVLTTKLGVKIEGSPIYTFGSIQKANELAKELLKIGINWNKQTNFGWAIYEHSENAAPGDDDVAV